jgi:hypothetical protein
VVCAGVRTGAHTRLGQRAAATPGAARGDLRLLHTICDFYTWKLLRRDSGLSRRQTEMALVELLAPLTETI